MKSKFFLFSIIMVMFSSIIFAQIKEGKIQYRISYPSLDLPAAQKAMLPSESVCYFSNNNCRSESDGIMGMKMVTICAKGETTMLIDVMGKKIAMNPLDNQSVKTKTPTITYSDETKNIAGFVCKKATMVFDETKKMIVWCAEGITGGGSWGGNFDNLKGAPLEYTADLNGMSMTMIASKVSDEKVGKKMFEIPSDYKSMTMEELQKQFKQ